MLRAEHALQEWPVRHMLSWSSENFSSRAITFVAGLRHNMMVAPFVVDGPMTRTTFLTYLERCLKSTLKHGDIVIIDNLPAHKGDDVQKVIKTARARLLYLPKYSPDLNPIERVFSKLKALLRKTAKRTIPGLCRKIGKLLGAFSARECANFLAHAGYASTGLESALDR